MLFLNFLTTQPKYTNANYLLATIIGCLPLLSVADELDTFQARASVGRTYDSNLFRRATGDVSEQITTSVLGAKIDKTYSLQRVVADLSFVDSKYNVNNYLDFVAKNYNLAWYWSLTPELTGTLSSERTQSLNSFGDFRVSTVQNIRTITTNQFRAQYSPHNIWSVIAGFSQMTLANSETFTAISDFDATGFDYGLMYQLPSGSSIKFMGHNRRGEFTKRPLNPSLAFDNGYNESEYEVNLSASNQSKSNLYAKFGYIEREYDNFKIRNYSSYIADLNYDLQLTGKLTSNISLSRVIAPFEAANSTYSLSDSVKGRLLYSVTSKIVVGLNLSYAERDFDGRGQFGQVNRVDKETSYGAFVRWSPIKNIGFSLNSSKSNRNSSISTFDFDDTLTTVNLDLKL